MPRRLAASATLAPPRRARTRPRRGDPLPHRSADREEPARRHDARTRRAARRSSSSAASKASKERTRDEFRPALLEDSLRDLRYGARALRRTPGFTARRHPHARARHRRHHRRLQRRQRRPDQAAAVSRAGSARRASGTRRPALELRPAAPASCARRRSTSPIATRTARSRRSASGTRGTAHRDRRSREPEQVHERWRHRRHAADARRLADARARGSRHRTTHQARRRRSILTYGYWQRRYGGDPSVVGRDVTIDAQPRADHRRHAARLPIPRHRRRRSSCRCSFDRGRAARSAASTTRARAAEARRDARARPTPTSRG